MISSCSLTKAIALPENETEPISTPSSTSAVTYTAGLSPSECRWSSSMIEISAAAPPPTPLKMATSWGMAVIFTMRATGTAMAAPSTMAMIVSMRFLPECRSVGRVKVMPTARVAAAAPTRLPRRACLGELRPFRAKMKPTMATR